MVKKLAVDFDGTLACIEVQQFVREFLEKKIASVEVVTTRQDRFHAKEPDRNNDLEAIIDWLGISRVNYTNLKDKCEWFLKNPGFVVHIDDNPWEKVYMEEAGCKTRCIIWHSTDNWRELIMECFN